MRARISTLAAWTFAVWTSVASSSGVAAPVSTSAPGDRQAQIEKGRQVVAQVCTPVTPLGGMIQVHKQTAEQWQDTVYFMISRGAQVMPDEIEPVTAFLAATAGSGSQTSRRRRAAGGQAVEAPANNRRSGRSSDPSAELPTVSRISDRVEKAVRRLGAVITRMVTYGARLTPADQRTLIDI